MPTLSALTFKASLAITITGQKNQTPTVLTATQGGGNFTKSVSLGTAAANAAAGGSDECCCFITTVAPSSSATVDLTSLTDVIGQSSVALVRVKSLTIQLLSATDDATNGTAAASVIVGNNGANDFISQSNSGWLGSATSNVVVKNGAVLSYSDGGAAGVAVDGTHKIIKLANNDAGLSAAVQSTVVGGTT